MKTGLMLFAALALVSVKANASPITLTSGMTAHVGFADLDLNSREGRAALEQRIRSASEALCENEGDRTLSSALGSRACYKAAVANGLEQMAEITQQRLAQRQASTSTGH